MKGSKFGLASVFLHPTETLHREGVRVNSVPGLDRFGHSTRRISLVEREQRRGRERIGKESGKWRMENGEWGRELLVGEHSLHTHWTLTGPSRQHDHDQFHFGIGGTKRGAIGIKSWTIKAL